MNKGKAKVLIVDDEEDICEILAFNLKSEGYTTLTVNSAEEGLKVLDDSIHIILLDIMMGGMSGYHFAEKIRKQGYSQAIIFITAKDSENEMLTGFSLGADDYITKPFSIKEVLARVNAVLKRLSKGQDKGQKLLNTEDSWTFRDLALKLKSKELFIKGEKVNLTKKEFEILVYFINNQDHIRSREDLISELWQDVFVTDRTVDVHIARLRKKLGIYAPIIINRSGYGYRLDTENFKE